MVVERELEGVRAELQDRGSFFLYAGEQLGSGVQGTGCAFIEGAWACVTLVAGLVTQGAGISTVGDSCALFPPLGW